jgi:hypothetical protein
VSSGAGDALRESSQQQTQQTLQQTQQHRSMLAEVTHTLRSDSRALDSLSARLRALRSETVSMSQTVREMTLHHAVEQSTASVSVSRSAAASARALPAAASAGSSVVPSAAGLSLPPAAFASSAAPPAVESSPFQRQYPAQPRSGVLPMGAGGSPSNISGAAGGGGLPQGRSPLPLLMRQQRFKPDPSVNLAV